MAQEAKLIFSVLDVNTPPVSSIELPLAAFDENRQIAPCLKLTFAYLRAECATDLLFASLLKVQVKMRSRSWHVVNLESDHGMKLNPVWC